jgi:phosphatidylglycerol:prolipoprotein diacylglycerol transferase
MHTSILELGETTQQVYFKSPGSILLNIGPLTIRWYGLMTALGFLAALYIARKLAQREDSSGKLADQIDNFMIVALMSGLVGARLWFVFLNSHYFSAHPLEIPQIWLGGQSIQGGMMGTVIGTFIYEVCCRSKPVDATVLDDLAQNHQTQNLWESYLNKLALIVTVIPLGQAIGRWGNFFNEEAFGTVTNLPWGLYISHTGKIHHPTFLYESLGDLVIFFIMLKLYARTHSGTKFSQKQAGAGFRLCYHQVIGVYLILYSCLRLAVESIRTDSLMLAGMPAATQMSYIAIAIGLILLIRLQR